MTNYRGVQGSPLFISVEQKEHTEQLKPKIRAKLRLISQGSRTITNTLSSSLPWVSLSCFCSLFEWYYLEDLERKSERGKGESYNSHGLVQYARVRSPRGVWGQSPRYKYFICFII